MLTALEQKTVNELFNGRSIFLTGVTGFVGKVLLEKLLRCCPEIKQIFVLVRSSDLENHEQRLNNLLEEQVFDRIRTECKNMLTKVTPINGDLGFPFCDMKLKDITSISNVSIVLHCAANVRFDESLRRSVAVNVEGVKHLIDVCYRLPALEALIHVSTAYAFCNQEKIEEKVYVEQVNPAELMNVCKWMGDEELDLLFQSVRNDRPSTYHFSKAVAENFLQEECQKDITFSACIVRPSIVTAAWREPFPGWVDTGSGPSGLIAVCGKGIVKSVHADAHIIADFVPVDVVVNTIIAAARQTLIKRALKNTKFHVINCTSNQTNPLMWGDIERICLPLLSKYPSMELYRYPGGSFKSSATLHRWSMIVDHMIPAYLIEMASYITLKPYRVVKMYHKMNNVLNHFEYFTTNEFDFDCGNYFNLMNEMTASDAKVFYVDTRFLDWTKYFEDYVPGVRKFLLKEKEETIPKAIRRMNKIYYMFLGFRISAYCWGAWIMYRQKPLFSKVLIKVLGLFTGSAFLPESVGKYLRLQ